MASHGPLVLIDGHNTFIRNYVRSPYTDVNGERMGGTTGMVISVRKILKDLRASNALVVWDGEGGSQRRKSIYKAYKEGRTVRLNERAENDFGETPEQRMENMRKQRNLSQDYLTIVGVPQVRADGVEADDLIAYVAGKMDHPSGCVIVTTDQDMLQLVRAAGFANPVEEGECPNGYMGIHNDRSIDGSVHATCRVCGDPMPRQSEVKVWSPIKKVLYDRERFISEYSVIPENFRLVKALTGDASDNIEGIKGFGAKTVAKAFPFLLTRRASAEEVLDAAGTLKGVLGKRLTEGKSRFLENLTLVDLSEPMLSATAARQARVALVTDLGCREVDFRIRVVKDSVSFGGHDFIGPFREFVLRRRRYLKEFGGGADE
jgi:DNA polymerase-1